MATESVNIADLLTQQLEQSIAGIMLNEPLVKAYVHEALHQTIESRHYNSPKETFLSKTLKEAIQVAARNAVGKVLAERQGAIEDLVREAVTRDLDALVDSLTKSLSNVAAHGYVSVNFNIPPTDRE